MPALPAGVTFERNLVPARQKLETAYKRAVTEYLKAKQDDLAEATEAEMKLFLASAPGAKLAVKDSYPVGTILAGQLRWNGDAGNHNYMLVITERSGKSFRGIARLDYGPSGNPNKKGLYDVEGEVAGLNLSYKGDLDGLNRVEAKWVKGGSLQVTATAKNGGILSGSLSPRLR